MLPFLYLINPASELISYFKINFEIYFYYYVLLLAALILAIVIAFSSIVKYLPKINKSSLKILALIIIAFFASELLFVAPFHLIYNDEYIYESIAKTMLYQHEFGICSFSNQLYCIPGTIGFFHQPGGWPLIESLGFSIFGVSSNVAFNTNLVFGALSILLVFMISIELFRDEGAAILSSLVFSFLPLFDTYVRTAIPDVSTMLFELLTIYLGLSYMRTKKTSIGVATVFAASYTLVTKVDGIIVIPILLLLFIANRNIFEGRAARNQIRIFGILAVLFILASTPALIFTYIANSHSFGANISAGQTKFGLSYLGNNTVNNALFFLGTYDSMRVSKYNYVYHVEFPVEITLLGMIGLIYLGRRGMHRELLFLVGWFALVFVFYSSYYAGSTLYGLGVDTRYYLADFASLSIMAGVGGSYLYSKVVHGINGPSKNAYIKKQYIAVFFAILIISQSLSQFITIVSLPPSKIATYSAERADESFLLQQYAKIPSGCAVVTFKAPFWYVMNRSNVYASWLSLPQYQQQIQNISHGCLYFDYGISCYINSTEQGNPQNTRSTCNAIMSEYVIQPVSTYNYKQYGWNVTFGLYKLLSKRNETT
jgi:hypothetical protein